MIQTCLDNFINGNLTDAKKQAKRIAARDLFDALIKLYGYTHHKARLTAIYLKNPCQQTYQMACDAK